MTVKEYLRQAYRLEQQISSDLEEVASLREMAISVSSPQLAERVQTSGKYSVSVLIPKDDKATVDAINAAVDVAIDEGISKFGGKKPNKAAIKLPLRDGDVEREDEAYKGHYFINANSNTAPQIVDRAVKPILDRSEVYSGCYARVSLNFYAFNSNGNKGIACGLGNIQKVRDGEPLDGRTNAADDFATLDDDDFLS